MAPLAPSSSLKDRIRQAASELDSAPAPPELPRMSEATARKNVVEVPFWRKPGFVAAAAALVVGLFAAKFFFSPDESEPAMASLIGDPDDELIIWGNPPRVDPSPFTLKNQVLVSQENDGIVEDDHGRPMWKIRIKVLDRNGSNKNAVPVERVVYVPVRHD
tara:strand:+ start:10493 stop:10975 length:483 start_codon:yes stop_codon:yes gene_type:complete